MELNIFRFTLMLVPLIAYFIWTKSGPLIPREKIIYVLMYGVLVSAEQVCSWSKISVKLVKTKSIKDLNDTFWGNVP